MKVQIVLRVTAALLLASPMVGLSHAQASPPKPPSSTPQIVDTNGKVLGPLGFSESIAQGVVVNTTDYVTSYQQATFGNVWILVPWGPNGLGYKLPAGAQLNPGEPGMFGLQYFFAGNNCQGVAYIPAQLTKNSATQPYSATRGIGDVVLFPIGTPKLGSQLGIASSQTFSATQQSPCQAVAWPSPTEKFAEAGEVGIGPEQGVFLSKGFRPPWSLSK